MSVSPPGAECKRQKNVKDGDNQKSTLPCCHTDVLFSTSHKSHLHQHEIFKILAHLTTIPAIQIRIFVLLPNKDGLQLGRNATGGGGSLGVFIWSGN